jgi:hypothetical protein
VDSPVPRALTAPHPARPFDLMVSLRQWGQDHAFAPGEQHSVLVDKETGRSLPRLSYATPDGHQVQARETRVRKVSEPAF